MPLIEIFSFLYNILCYFILLYFDSANGLTKEGVRNGIVSNNIYHRFHFDNSSNLDNEVIAEFHLPKYKKRKWKSSPIYCNSGDNHLYHCLVSCKKAKNSVHVLCCGSTIELNSFYFVSKHSTKKCCVPNCKEKCKHFTRSNETNPVIKSNPKDNKLKNWKYLKRRKQRNQIPSKSNYYLDNLTIQLIREVLKFPRLDLDIKFDQKEPHDGKYNKPGQGTYVSSTNKKLIYPPLFKNELKTNNIKNTSKNFDYKYGNSTHIHTNCETVTNNSIDFDKQPVKLKSQLKKCSCKGVGKKSKFTSQKKKMKNVLVSGQLDEMNSFNPEKKSGKLNNIEFNNGTSGSCRVYNHSTARKLLLPSSLQCSRSKMHTPFVGRTLVSSPFENGKYQNTATTDHSNLGNHPKDLSTEPVSLTGKTGEMNHTTTELSPTSLPIMDSQMIKNISILFSPSTVANNILNESVTPNNLALELFHMTVKNKFDGMIEAMTERNSDPEMSTCSGNKHFIQNIILKDYSDYICAPITHGLFSNSSKSEKDTLDKKVISKHEECTCEYANNVCLPTTKHVNDENSFKQRFPYEKNYNSDDILDESFKLHPYNISSTIKSYIMYIENMTAEVYHSNKIAMWAYETNITIETEEYATLVSAKVTKYQQALNRVLIQIGVTDDKEISREIKLLYQPGACMLPENKYHEFQKLVFGMKLVHEIARIPIWQKPSIKIPLAPDVSYIMARSRDPVELQYYWKEWRKSTGKKIKHRFIRYIHLMKASAIINGFADAGQMWTSKYETEDLLQMAGSQWEEIRPLYLQLHAYVRKKLHERYGDLVSTRGKPIPVHLTGDMWGKSWKNLCNIVMPYPEKRIESIDNEFKKEGYTIVKMAQKAQGFFHSMGFPALPNTFWRNSIFQRDRSRQMSCESSAWDMHKQNDVRIKMCAQVSMADFVDLHHQMAHVEYFLQYKNLPYSFQRGANPAFHEAIAGALEIFILSNNHLNALGLKRPIAKNDEVDINYLLRIALDKLPFIPYSYVVDLWRYKIFQGDIKEEEFNQKWWELRLQYQGVAPPEKRVRADFDPGSIFHVAANKPFLRYYLASIMQFQFHEALCKKAIHQGPLHNCDITSSSIAGKVLKGIMKLGASKHWRIALESVTGHRSVDSGPLLRYFEPLHHWLKNENSRTKQQIGWEEAAFDLGRQTL